MDTALRVIVFSSKLLWMIVVGLAKIGVGLASVAIPLLLAALSTEQSAGSSNDFDTPGYNDNVVGGFRDDVDEPVL